MEVIISVVIGLLFAIGTYLLLTRNLLRIIFGTVILSHAAHLLLLAMGGLKKGAPPIYDEEIAMYTDPLPQALILTSIVISFGITSFFLVLAYRTYKVHETDDVNELKETDK